MITFDIARGIDTVLTMQGHPGWACMCYGTWAVLIWSEDCRLRRARARRGA